MLEGFNYSKAAYIITNQHEEVAKRIMSELDRGVTGLHAKGMYTGDEKCMLYCIVSQKEIVMLKDIVNETDPNAFVIVSEVREVLGEGFQEYKKEFQLKITIFDSKKKRKCIKNAHFLFIFLCLCIKIRSGIYAKRKYGGQGDKTMISNQILQNTIDGLKNITKTDLCVIDVEGKILAATFSDTDKFIAPAQSFAASPADSQVVGGCQFFKVFDEHQLEYILIAYGDSDDAYMIGKIASFQIQNLLVAYKERFDKDNFIKNLLLDNLLLVDIYNRAKKLHIETEVKRVVFIVETNRDKDGNELEKIRSLFGGKSKDFVTAVDEKNIIVVKELAENEKYEDLSKTADVIINLFRQDADHNVHVAYGTIVNELKEVSRSYKEARMALDVGKIFFEEKDVIAYSQLGIGRLIYQLPIPLCKMFIKEIFDGKSPDDFDEEILSTINKFFENSLNVSETSRQLYIHRNTLVYRLDKLQKSTGLDLRVFEDAITFRIALMVVKYMKYMESLDY